MKKNYSFFIAGPTEDSREERECLKILANDLNSEYRAQELHINAMSYRNFDDNQERYNDFIKNEADLAFFVLKGGIGEKTLEEFITAAEAWRAKKLPEIVVFLHRSADNNSAEIGKIYGLMEGLLNKQYPIRYNSLEELRAEAKLRIGRHIQKWLNEPKSRITESVLEKTTPKQEQKDFANSSVPNSICRHRIIWMICIAVVLIGGLFLWKNFLYRPKPTILFAGGGSAASYLKQYAGIDLYNYKGGVFANMPSGNAWPLLSEEYYRHHNLAQKPIYVTLCVSAKKIDTTKMLIACDGNALRSEGTVVKCLLGFDTLTVYIQQNLYDEFTGKGMLRINDTVITKQQLAEIINLKNSINIFSTSATSGTALTYQELFSSDTNINFEKMLNNGNLSHFNEASTLPDINNSDKNKKKNYVVLGSTSYFINDLKTEQTNNNFTYKALRVCDEKKQFVKKPIILYFVAFLDNNNQSYTVIPKPIWDFLNKEGMKTLIGKEYLKEIKNRRLAHEGLFTPLRSKASMNPMVKKEEW